MLKIVIMLKNRFPTLQMFKRIMTFLIEMKDLIKFLSIVLHLMKSDGILLA